MINKIPGDIVDGIIFPYQKWYLFKFWPGFKTENPDNTLIFAKLDPNFNIIERTK